MVQRTIFAISIIFLLLLTMAPVPTKAASAQNWNAGLIISDAVFTNNNSMSAHDIQAFLNAKVPTCDTWHAGSGSNQPPFTCLKDFHEGGISAAQIIWNKAQEFRINPQVLLVLLQKEQGLVTDTWPWASQYRTATGYACFDDGQGCTGYFGFTNQVHYAARMFRKIMDNDLAGWWLPFPSTGTHSIKYDVEDICGGSAVNIQNRATLALYNYTPYQPNSSALANLYGSAEPCGAYGNRNFWRDFTDWFGNPHGLPYQWSWVTQNPPIYLATGDRTTFTLTARNTGTATWSNTGPSPVRLGASSPQDRSSLLCDSTWIACNRAATLNESSVAPGQEGTFTFTGQMPSTPGIYHEKFSLLVEGNTWMNDVGQYFHITVVPATEYAGQSNSPTLLAGGSSATVYFLYRHMGGQTWYDDTGLSEAPAGTKPVHLSTSKPFNRLTGLQDNWLNGNRPVVNFSAVYEADGVTLASNQHRATGNQIVKFAFNFRAPAGHGPGTWREHFQPIIEGGSTMNDPGTYLDVTVQPPIYSAAYAGQSGYPTSITPGGPATPVYFLYKNTGNQAWYDDTSLSGAPAGTKPMHLATSRPINRLTGLQDSWINGNRPALNFAAVYEADGTTLASNQHVAQPGQIVKFAFNFRAPAGHGPGTWREHFQPIIEGGSTMNDPGTYLDAIVQ